MARTRYSYPEHIYSRQRIDLARIVLEKETRKLLLGLSDEAWQSIDRSIKGWEESPLDYHLESDGPRDFWDSFAAVMESIKIKPNFTAWITAENVTWRKTTLPISSIQMTSPLEQLKKIPNLKLRNDIPFAELTDVLNRDPDARQEQKRLIDEHSTDPAQDRYPVVVRQADNGLFKVMDGNRRTLKAVIYGKREIEAWVGEINGKDLINYWVPLNDMLQLLKVYKEATDSKDEPLQKAVVQILRARFRASEVARQAYQNRIANQAPIGQRLFELATKQ